ncbi:MAG: hypothetical protein ACI9LA_000687 [Bacteroidia bacterium]
MIADFLAQPDERELKQTATVLWLGSPVSYDISESVLSITTKQETIHLECPIAEGQWLSQVLNEMTPTSSKAVSLKIFEDSYQQQHLDDFESLWESELMEEIREVGLLIL